MSNETTDAPTWVQLAVHSIRCFGNPTDEPTIRLLIDTWYHREQLTEADVESVVAQVAIERAVMAPDEEYERGWVDGAAKVAEALSDRERPGVDSGAVEAGKLMFGIGWRKGQTALVETQDELIDMTGKCPVCGCTACMSDGEPASRKGQTTLHQIHEGRS